MIDNLTPDKQDLIELLATYTPVDEDLYTLRPDPSDIFKALTGAELPKLSISDIPPTEHHHLTCENCGILWPCYDLNCRKTTGVCHDCATESERPAWSPKEALRRFEAKRTAEARQRLIAELIERLPLLTDLELCKVASFIEEVMGR